MAKLNLFLVAILLACALALVTSQHRVRRAHAELERELQREREAEIEFGRLQLEAATWGLPARVEKIAAGSLGMHTPSPQDVRAVARTAHDHDAGAR